MCNLKLEEGSKKLMMEEENWTDEVTSQSNRADMIEENFKDIISSWIGISTEENLSHPRDYVESEDEKDDQELMQMTQKNFSVVTSYGHDNSFDSLMVERKMILKMHLASGKQEGQNSEPTKEPYAHLKARNVFGKQAIEYNKQIELVMHNPDNRTKAKMLIELSKDFLTHMDHSQFTVDRLPLEIFDDFLLEADSIKQRIENRRQNRLEPLRAKT